MSEFREIVRICDSDVKGNLSLELALQEIKGLGSRMSTAISKVFEKKTGFSRFSKIGDLPKENDSVLNEIILNPTKFGISSFMLNRKKVRLSGEDKHIISSDLDFAKREDISLLSRTKARRGLRHMLGLPVRGRKTHSQYRSGKGAVGVSKKK